MINERKTASDVLWLEIRGKFQTTCFPFNDKERNRWLKKGGKKRWNDTDGEEFNERKEESDREQGRRHGQIHDHVRGQIYQAGYLQRSTK